jgi:TfoX/Sxy family transcriptional regulator of competence genes
MAYDEALADRIRSVLPRGVTEKAMFGGMAFLFGGNMSVGVVEDRMVVRLHPDEYDATLQQTHVREMDFSGRPMKGWVYVEPAGIKTPQQLAAWVRRGVDYAKSLPAKKPKAKKR